MKKKLFTLLFMSFVICSCSREPVSNAYDWDKEVEQKDSEYVNFEVETSISPFNDQNKRVDVSSGKRTYVDDSNYVVYSCDVIPGYRYNTSFKVSTNGYYCYVFTDVNDQVVGSHTALKDNNSSTEYVDFSILAPKKASILYINCLKSYSNFNLTKLSIKAKKKEDVASVNLDKKSLTILANNIGEYDYGDSTYTKEEYKQHWNKMLTENPYDFYGFEDLIDTYTDGVTASKDLLGVKGAYWNQIASFGRFDALSSQVKPIRCNMIMLPHTVSGKSSKRCVAFRCTFLINNRLTAIYVVHLVAEGHINVTNSKGVYYLSQQLRQNQFQTIIEDTKAYDEAIVIGDFNCQSAETTDSKVNEYQTWVDAGFNIGNGSAEYGEIKTLIRAPGTADAAKKDVPADNIICTSGLKIKTGTFKKLDGYDLNTDHRPVKAELEFVD